MAELGVAASVIAVIQLTAEVGKRLTQYGISVKNAAKDIREIKSRLKGIEAVLQKLNELAKRVEKSGLPLERWPTLLPLESSEGPIKQTERAMVSLREKLVLVDGTKKMLAERLKWPMKKKRVEGDVDAIEKQKLVFMELLRVEHMAQSIDTGHTVSKLEQTDIDYRRNEIVRWLSSTDPSTNHIAARKKHEDQTGKWFTQGKEYQIWKEGLNSFLWLHGIPGSGKTILCSEIIVETLKYCEARPAFHLVYFYFSFQDTDKQKITMFLRSMISQLVIQIGSVPSAVQTLYESYKFSPPPIDRLLSVIHALIDLSAVGEIFLIIDALDECPNDKAERDNLCDILSQIKGWGLHNLHTLVTSRPEVDLIKSLAPLTTSPPISIEDSVVKSDIQKFVKTSLAESRLKQWPAHVQDEIEQTLIDGAHGMFRWVDCQLVALTKCLTRNDIKRALKSLPKTLDETYERILVSIDEEHRPMLATALKWISAAKRPLTVKEIAEAIVINPNEKPPFHEDNRLPDPDWIIPILSSLVVISTYEHVRLPRSYRGNEYAEDSATIVNLAHFSVEEYLTSERILGGPAYIFHMEGLAAEKTCAEGSLLYLDSFFNSERRTLSYLALGEFPLLKYASKFWHLHALFFQGWEVSGINDLVLKIMLSKNSRESWLWFFNPDTEWYTIVDFEPQENLDLPSYTPLYLLASLGFKKHLQVLIDEGVDIDTDGGWFGTALQGAIFHGQTGSVDVLLDAGADASKTNGYHGHALRLATNKNDLYITRRLLDTGIDVDMYSPTFGTALQDASSMGYVEIIRMLVDAGANVNASPGNYDTALGGACLQGNITTINLLLELGADVNLQTIEDEEHQDDSGNDEKRFHGFSTACPLEAAACSGRTEVANLLFEAGAINDLRGTGGCTPLEALVKPVIRFTCHDGPKEMQARRVMARLLLDKGADVGLLKEENKKKLKQLLDDELCQEWLEKYYQPAINQLG